MIPGFLPRIPAGLSADPDAEYVECVRRKMHVPSLGYIEEDGQRKEICALCNRTFWFETVMREGERPTREPFVQVY